MSIRFFRRRTLAVDRNHVSCWRCFAIVSSSNLPIGRRDVAMLNSTRRRNLDRPVSCARSRLNRHKSGVRCSAFSSFELPSGSRLSHDSALDKHHRDGSAGSDALLFGGSDGHWILSSVTQACVQAPARCDDHSSESSGRVMGRVVLTLSMRNGRDVRMSWCQSNAKSQAEVCTALRTSCAFRR